MAPSFALLLPDSLSRATIGALAAEELPASSRSILESPRSVEAALSSELVTTFSEASYLLSWRARKAATGEFDTRSQRALVSLETTEIDFIRNLSNGKLAYLVTFVTREGLSALIELGEREQPLSKLSDLEVFKAKESPEDIRETLARLHHENWLNQNAVLERVNRWNHEWGEYPEDLFEGYEIDRVQVDMDCRALAGLPESLRERLLSLASPGDGSSFFHADRFLSVRSPAPVQHDREGAQFARNRERDELVELARTVMTSPGGARFYEIHTVLDRLETSLRDRAIIQNLLYRGGGRIDEGEFPSVIDKLSRLPNDISQSDAPAILAQLFTQNTVGSPNAVAGKLNGLRVEYPEKLLFVQSFQERYAQHALAQDVAELGSVFRHVDELGDRIHTDEFGALAAKLREIAAVRKELVGRVSIGLLSTENFDAIAREFRDGCDHFSSSKETLTLEIARALPEQAAQSLERALIHHRLLKGSLLASVSSHRPNPARTPSELLTLNTFSSDFPMLRALVEKHLIQRQDRDVARQGGILVDHFNYDFLAKHLSAGNWILVKRRAFDAISRFDGVFIYCAPGNYPSDLSSIVKAVTPANDLSFAQLFVTHPDRTPGTYQQLLAWMAAHLALADVRYSMGTMLENNLRHKHILTKNDHYTLLGASVYRDELKARYIPMLWKLP
jgi:hypothetical protein